jgi:hypothetical protein
MATTAAPSPDAELAHRAARAALVNLARLNPSTFVEQVMRDERTGQAIELAPMHEEWHRLMDRHAMLVLLAHYESGKTAGLSVGRVLYELGRDPTLRVCVLSNTYSQATKIVRAVAGYIEKSSALHEVFPNLRRAEPWRDDLITVHRPVISKDASLVGVGLHGAVLGSRFDLVVIDDLEDYESTRTETQRRTTMEWLTSTVLTRMTSRGRVVAVGTCWHKDDALAQLSRMPGWASFRFPVVNEDTGQPNWSERWPLSRVEEARVQLGPFESARALDLRPQSDEESVFRPEWLAGALEHGNGLPVYAARPFSATLSSRIVVGVDLGVSTKKTADLTALVTVLVNGHARQLLNVEAGRWHIDDIARRIEAHHRRYEAQTIVVESVAAQEFVIGLMKRTRHVPCIGFKTGAGKMSLPYQAELLGAELAAGRWSFPNEAGRLAPEVRMLVADLGAYTAADHCGDRLAALLMARWGAEQGDRRAQVFWHDLLLR